MFRELEKGTGYLPGSSLKFHAGENRGGTISRMHRLIKKSRRRGIGHGEKNKNVLQ